ncbi:hypothetical protein Bca4012_053492 [Brassica carinata]
MARWLRLVMTPLTGTVSPNTAVIVITPRVKSTLELATLKPTLSGTLNHKSKKRFHPCEGKPGKLISLRYNVTKYIYATASIKMPLCFIVKSLSKKASRVQTNWMGYIAVATDEGKAMLGRRDIVVAWRGTLQPYEWANDFDFPLESGVKVFPVTDSKHVPRIGSGWLDVYTASDAKSPYDTTSAREQVQAELKRLLEVYKNEEVSITFTGHSLGGVMSTLAAADLVHSRKNMIETGLQSKQVPITVFAFGCPRIGDQDFKRTVNSHKDLNILRIVNVPDVAPNYPLFLYAEVGEVLQINTLNSTYLKRSLNWRNYHNLEIYLHGIAGMQDKAGVFKLEIGRDVSLRILDVNKTITKIGSLDQL